MKLLMESWRKYLDEAKFIKSAKPYNFSFGDTDVFSDYKYYRFITEGDIDYMVIFDRDTKLSYNKDIPSDPPEDDDYWDIHYRVVSGPNTRGAFELTNEGRLMQILATIAAIVKDFIKTGRNDGVRTFQFEGTDKYGENPREITSRTRIYKILLKEYVPEAEIISLGGPESNRIQFVLPPETISRVEDEEEL